MCYAYPWQNTNTNSRSYQHIGESKINQKKVNLIRDLKFFFFFYFTSSINFSFPSRPFLSVWVKETMDWFSLQYYYIPFAIISYQRYYAWTWACYKIEREITVNQKSFFFFQTYIFLVLQKPWLFSRLKQSPRGKIWLEKALKRRPRSESMTSSLL